MYSYTTRVRYSELAEDRCASLVSIINYFQDCSTFESEDGDIPEAINSSALNTWIFNEDTIHKVLMNLDTYTPRKNYLQYRGRKNFIKTVATEIPYYRENIPNFNDGNLFENQWINEACMDNYGVLYQDFLYDKLCNWSNVASLEATLELVNSYLKKFCIKKKRTLLRNLLAKKTP